MVNVYYMMQLFVKIFRLVKRDRRTSSSLITQTLTSQCGSELFTSEKCKIPLSSIEKCSDKLIKYKITMYMSTALDLYLTLLFSLVWQFVKSVNLSIN